MFLRVTCYYMMLPWWVARHRCCPAARLAQAILLKLVSHDIMRSNHLRHYLPGMVAHAGRAEAGAADVGAREAQRRPQGSQLRDGAAQTVTDGDDALRRAAVRQSQQHAAQVHRRVAAAQDCSELLDKPCATISASVRQQDQQMELTCY